MYTQCPYCQTCFRVAEAHLKAAKGKVRCGSCKQIFDATEHLYEGVPGSGIKKPVRPAIQQPRTHGLKPTPDSSQAPPTSTTSKATPRYNEITPGEPEIPEKEHEHVDLSTPPDRSNAPDQTRFMESIIGEYSRYNNLDEMGSIQIPGGENFTDSLIKHIDEDEIPKQDDLTKQEKPEATEEIQLGNPYTDTDSLELPATTEERDGIDALYTAADSQIFEQESKEQLDRDIEALLGDDLTFDDDVHEEQNPDNVAEKQSTGFSGMDSIRFNRDADIAIPTGESPKLMPNEGEVQPLDVVSSDDIWSNKDKDEASTNISKPVPDETETARNREAADEIEFGDSFLDLDSEISRPEKILEFEAETGFGDETDSEPVVLEETEVVLESESVINNAPEEESIEADLPSFEHEIPKVLRSSFESYEAPTRPLGLSISMFAGIVILVVALLVQVVLFNSYQLANQVPSMAPLLTSLCSTLPCRYSGSIDVSKIEVLNRDMHSHPSQKNALVVSAAFVNKAKFDQPYPVIAIKLFDLSGDTVATRYFKPSEYLDKLYSKFLLMESGTPVHISLSILDPGDDAVNFEISFQ